MTIFLSHRGESDDAPENTLEAFQLAMKRDSDGIELDIRRTIDGALVCVHDATLERVAGTAVEIAETPLSRIQAIHPVPLLRDALERLLPGKLMQVELKGCGTRLIPALKQVLKEWNGNKAQLFLSSFEEETIRSLAHEIPDLPRILLLDLEERFGVFPDARRVAEYGKERGASGISFKASTLATAEFVSQLRQEGLRVVCWGISSDQLGIQMAEIGVDAMTCNHAVALRRVWREKNASGNALH